MFSKNFENLVAQHNTHRNQDLWTQPNRCHQYYNPAEANEIDMDRAYVEKRPGKHHQTSTSMEPTRKEEKRKAKKHLA